VVGRGLDEVPRGVASLVDGLAESHDRVGRLRPGAEHKTLADDPARLEEVDEVVEPVDEECLDPFRLAGELVAFPLLDRLEVADEVEQRTPGCREQVRSVGAFEQ